MKQRLGSPELWFGLRVGLCIKYHLCEERVNVDGGASKTVRGIHRGTSPKTLRWPASIRGYTHML